MANALPTLEKVVAGFVQDVRRVAEQAALETLRRELGVAGPRPVATRTLPRPEPTVPVPVPPAGRSRGRQRRTPAALAATKEALVSAIEKEPGRRFEEIRIGLGRPRSELERPLRQLVADGAVRSKGVKRATRYYPAAAR